MLAIRDNKIFFCLGLAVTAHFAILNIPVASITPQSKQKPTVISLKIRHKKPPSKSTILEQPDLPVPTKETETEKTDRPGARSDHEASHDNLVKPEITIVEEELKPTERENLLSSITVIESLRAQLLKEGRLHNEHGRTKTFSSEDFATPKPPPSFARQALLPKLLPAAYARSSLSASGQSTDIVRAANGEAMCWQQRGIPGESQQWYRVPLSLCGHLTEP